MEISGWFHGLSVLTDYYVCFGAYARLYWSVWRCEWGESQGHWQHCGHRINDNYADNILLIQCCPIMTWFVFLYVLNQTSNGDGWAMGWVSVGISKFWLFHSLRSSTGIILGMGSTNERWRYIVMVSLIDWVHNQNDPCEWYVYRCISKLGHHWLR